MWHDAGAADRQLGISVFEEVLKVSTETIEQLLCYENLLIKWQKSQSLVSRETMLTIWSRHFCDSARLLMLIPHPGIWLDLGSGAGFPGLVMAILQGDKKDKLYKHHVHLVESNSRKVAFLRSVIRETGIQATVHECRIEKFNLWQEIRPNFVSARALSPLVSLLELSLPVSEIGAHCFFHKGRDIDTEISTASNMFEFDLLKHQGMLSNRLLIEGVIVEISAIRRKTLMFNV